MPKKQPPLAPGEKRALYPVEGAEHLKLDRTLRRELHGLGKLHCTLEEVGAFLGHTKGTIIAFFKREPMAKRIYEDGYSHGKVSLRRAQFRLAETNASMGIFLGKNYLSQTDGREGPASSQGVTVNLISFQDRPVELQVEQKRLDQQVTEAEIIPEDEVK